jgi:restriction system protein
MITERQPADWRELQHDVARILSECGMHTEVEKSVPLARGAAEIDVFAVETIRGRTNTIFCECKLWARSIPQHVIHAFRTVVADGGANYGYVITSSDFQHGALTAADLTNLRLVNWAEFQSEFEGLWIENHLRPWVTERLDPLLSYVEPILPRAFEELSEDGKLAFLEVRERYIDFGAIVMLFTTYGTFISPTVPPLPLRARFPPTADADKMPPGMLDATAYGDLLDILIPHGERAFAELRGALGRRPDGSV